MKGKKLINYFLDVCYDQSNESFLVDPQGARLTGMFVMSFNGFPVV
jgi:hypothetical protein